MVVLNLRQATNLEYYCFLLLVGGFVIISRPSFFLFLFNMCWIGKKGPIILDKDMSVFKIVVNKGVDIYSYYQSFLYQLNKLYTTELDVQNANGSILLINRGFHSYSTKCSVEKIDNYYITVHSTLDCYDNEICYDRSAIILIQSCIIPSGSTVYINKFGEVVSDKIILTEKQIVMNKVIPNYITDLDSNEIFVFGSNKSGLHLGGAAAFALENFGAKMGIGEGLTGQCYALPTMEGINSFKEAVDKFEECVKEHPELKFLVTEVGCGIAGYTPEEVAPLFKKISTYPNVSLPISFWNVIIN